MWGAGIITKSSLLDRKARDLVTSIFHWRGVIASVLVVFGAAAVVMSLRLEELYKDAAYDVCNLIEENYFMIDTPEGHAFVGWCRLAAEKQRFVFSKALNIRRINARLSQLKTSHLSIYNPDENRRIWENQGVDTGIRSRIIDARLVINRVIKNSPADRAGLKPGDDLVTLNGMPDLNSDDVQVGAGIFHVIRLKKEFDIEIKPEVVAEDITPTLTEVAGVKKTGVLHIPSFLWHFEPEAWRSLTNRLSKYNSIIIDLRENPGGSFPAMLRALSPFMCTRDSRVIGKIFRAKNDDLADAVDLLDNLDAQSQLQQLEEANTVRLKPFKNYGCYTGALAVLIDARTSSVAEIFAEALRSRPKAEILGQPSAGQVVMAKWFPLSSFGSEDYLISIPIAGYKTAAGETLEDRGVHPKVYLDYDLARSLQGRDTWLEDASHLLHTAQFVSK